MAPIDELLRAARARLRRLTPAEAAAAQADGGLIVDIRADAQREADGLVPGALVVPRNVLEWRADPAHPDRDARLAAVRGAVVLMCAEGFASSLAAATLHDLGVAGATDMVGGFVAWRAAGLPVLQGPADAPPSMAAGTPAATALDLLLEVAGPDDPLLDVGGGASGLAAAALAAGFRDVTVLDPSAEALAAGRASMGGDATRVSWVRDDVLTWVPPRRYAVWHDGAVLRLLTEADDRRRYAEVLRAAVRAGGHTVIAAPGPAGDLGWALARRA